MQLINVFSVVIYALGALAFGALLLDFVRECRSHRRIDWLGGALIVVSFAWFVDLLLLQFALHDPNRSGDTLRLIQFVLMYCFPPLIASLTLKDKVARGDFNAACRSGLPRNRSFKWNLVIGLFYLASLSIVTYALLAIFGVIPSTNRTVNLTIGIGIGALFGLVSLFSIVALTRGKREPSESETQRGVRRSNLVLFGVMLAIVVLIFVSYTSIGVTMAEALQLVGTSMPLLFIFAGSYHENRFEFFDWFVKRGLALMLTLGALAAWFALVLPTLEIYQRQSIGPWFLAVAALPVAIALPWVYRRLSHWVDTRWLGRRFTTVEAVKGFLANLQTATGERELVERAEQGLATLFRAPTRIDLELREAGATDFASAQDVPIRSGERQIGAIRMGRRANQMPYFSEDIALLVSLGDVFSYMLENVRLQIKKQEHEQRARELAHHASISELRALRAQINPHFLFNALNAIAGLIHKDPFRADATVEQLAEVFRYTLRGSQKEWARLEDEMEFVEAYLAVERARFGERLQVKIDTDDDVRAVRIPTMVIQTVVENAVKHGVASVRGEARVAIHARRDDDRVIVEVTDNGPGFDAVDAPSTRPRAKGANFGLKSVRERFRGYFGDRAELTTERDDDRGITVVRLTLPFEHDLGVDPGEAANGSTGVA